MPGFFQIKFLPDGPVTDFNGAKGNFYALDDGSRVEMSTRPVWCRHCGKVAHGEDIPSLAEIDNWLAELNNPTSRINRIPQRTSMPTKDDAIRIEKSRSERIEKAKRMRTWRERRQSGPKCTLCGSTDILVFPINEEIQNPAGHGTVRVSLVGFVITVFKEVLFSPEGDRLKADTKHN
jgi:hypothetical protein